MFFHHQAKPVNKWPFNQLKVGIASARKTEEISTKLLEPHPTSIIIWGEFRYSNLCTSEMWGPPLVPSPRVLSLLEYCTVKLKMFYTIESVVFEVVSQTIYTSLSIQLWWEWRRIISKEQQNWIQCHSCKPLLKQIANISWYYTNDYCFINDTTQKL